MPSIARTARFGDGWLASWCSAARFTSVVEQISAAAIPLARTPTGHGIQLWVGIDDNPARARARLAKGMEAFYRIPFERFEKYSPYGTPDVIAAWLRPTLTQAAGSSISCRLRAVIARARSHRRDQALPVARTLMQGHEPSHGHHQHAQEHALGRAFVLIAAFVVVEGVGGWMANALTLLADAGHMFLDASALGLSWYAVRLSRRESDADLSYGYHRFQVLAAFVNGLLLLALCTFIAIEAVGRLQQPEPMIAGPALAIACIGLIVNLIAYRMLHSHADASINVRSATLHVMGDILGSLAAIMATGIVLATGWTYADPLLAFVVIAILLRGAIRVLREATHILAEGVPKHLDLAQIGTRLAECVNGVQEVHHIHAWALTSDRPLLTLHARVAQMSDAVQVVAQIKHVLLRDFGIDHSTVQVEQGPCPDDAH
ncbi:MAG: cation diffusion facilitator family transporter [Gammaproteobacteria bacterium]|nr:cation diffusion facilitator family transporter [Gammaproteobacteria bacterium]